MTQVNLMSTRCIGCRKRSKNYSVNSIWGLYALLDLAGWKITKDGAVCPKCKEVQDGNKA